MTVIDFALLAEPVVRQLLGEPNAALSTKTELRFGTKGSLSVSLETGTWYDHEEQEGGGILALIKRDLPNVDPKEWLRQEGFLEFFGEYRPEPARTVQGDNDQPPAVASDVLEDAASDSSAPADDGSTADEPPPDNSGAARSAETTAETTTGTTIFDYRDEKGARLYQVVRVDAPGQPKKVRQRRPDGRGGWVWKLGDVRRVLYRLPELNAAPVDVPVLIPEGENKVDALMALGCVATCNSGGARKWKEEFREFFVGRDVVLMPDNDEAGRAHVEMIARGLVGYAKRIRVLVLPGLKTKGDMIDWLAEGGTRDRLDELIAALKDWVPPDSDGAEEFAGTEALTDLGNARRLVRLYGDDLRYVDKWCAWLVWKDGHWQRDASGAAVMRMAKAAVESMFAEADKIGDDARRTAIRKYALQSQSVQHLKGVKSLGNATPLSRPIPTPSERLDLST